MKARFKFAALLAFWPTSVVAQVLLGDLVCNAPNNQAQVCSAENLATYTSGLIIEPAAGAAVNRLGIRAAANTATHLHVNVAGTTPTVTGIATFQDTTGDANVSILSAANASSAVYFGTQNTEATLGSVVYSSANDALTFNASTKFFVLNTTGMGVDDSSLGTNGTLVVNGRMQFSGTGPTVGTCGSGPSIATNSTDNVGRITTGTGTVTACTLTFGTAWTIAPVCMADNEDVARTITVSSVSTTAVTFSFSSSSPADDIPYKCFGFES